MGVLLLHSVVLLFGFSFASPIELKAYISEQGLHGTISFVQQKLNDKIVIKTDLSATLQYPSQVWSWFITEFPVDYSISDNGRCGPSKLGKSLISLENKLGYLIIPDNQTSEFETDLKLTSDSSIFGKSLLLKNVETQRQICASLSFVDKSSEKTAIARFHTPVAGNVFFRWFSTKDNRKDLQIVTDLYHVHNVERINKTMLDHTEHVWKLYVTDILDADNEREEANCNILQLVFDPENKGDGKSIGDIDTRIGKIKISTDYNKRRFKQLFRDDKLDLLPSDLNGPQRRLFLVIFENKHPDSFLACAKIRYDHPIVTKVLIQSGGINGDIVMKQHNRFEPTFLNFNITTARGDLETRVVYGSSVASFWIHELPMSPAKTVGQTGNPCLTTKFIFNPHKININEVPPNGYGTQDQYAIGDLSGKLLRRNNESQLVHGSQELIGKYWDVFLPLIGKDSVVHRSLVIYKNTQYPDSDITSEPWICGSVLRYEDNLKYQKQIFTAQVIFRYPLVGRILFRQPKGEPWVDTTMLVEYLVHADGSTLNNSMDHRWAIHVNPPGKDFYNWTARCLSAGPIFNPYKVDFKNETPSEGCSLDTIGVCRMGDLSTRQGTLDIAGKIVDSDRITRKLITDQNLPLTGFNKIIGKSFVMYDDFGPKARGERLACSIIGGVYRRKAVAKDWFANGDNLTVSGKLEFYQQTEYDITNVEVELDGLLDNSGYHIHVTPVEENLAFPCEGSTLYDHWNPSKVDPATSPRHYQGTTDQYEMGDLSGKFGTLDNQTMYTKDYNDTILPLFGPRSILGRSVIIHKRDKNRRWACSTIERGYSPSEARELRAIASFHHPDGFAYGYMKMTQLVYNDGSMSDTIIEVKLRHPGKNDRNMTRDHNWAIFVNPVGVDAAVKTQNTRCVAGGYVWNPYYTQLADPLNEDLYRQECGPENPLRCHVGDMSGRLGTIDIGLKRKVFTDSNFPLEGPVTAMGRSIVIMSPNKQPQRYACANIEADYNIIKYANIEKPPRFVLAQFIEDVRRVMGIPEWMLTVDTRKTRMLHSYSCVQFLMHFKGPIASRLEQDFNKLLSTGRLESPTLYIPGFYDAKRKSKISYKLCGVRDPNEKSKKKSRFSFSLNKGIQQSASNYMVYLFGIILFWLIN
ncbi:PREDICTED: uncharacterized protein LOC108565217 [Nicrophorus vespilloides]|uniref:Uncharacterized protein LOC108565217 n=1 Tax=Nicrophorus vespilloides TaxID=110193 RepID=A0ABM1MZP5_NICVS|nr:PREDICTED: uncharacterized protein LOC108565217 [Nicrophorus vespilloides]